jgi:hypothetical protein
MMDAQQPDDRDELTRQLHDELTRLLEGLGHDDHITRQMIRDGLSDPQVSASLKKQVWEYLRGQREEEDVAEEPEPERPEPEEYTNAEIVEPLAKEPAWARKKRLKAAELERLMSGAPTGGVPELSLKLLRSVIRIALKKLHSPTGTHYDDLASAAGEAITLHVLKGGKLDKALLVTVAYREMVDWLRTNKQRFQTEWATDDLSWASGDETFTEKPPGKRKRNHDKTVLWVDKRFRGSKYFYAPSKVPKVAPDPDDAVYKIYLAGLAECIAEGMPAEYAAALAVEQFAGDVWELRAAPPAEIARILSNRLGTVVSEARVNAVIRKDKLREREDESARLDAAIADLAAQGLNQTEIGEALRLSQVGIHKRIKQIEARQQKWRDDGHDKVASKPVVIEQPRYDGDDGETMDVK